MTELHKKAVAFVQCAASQDTSGNHDENNEIALFLIGLVADHERQQVAAQGKEVKTVSSVAAVFCAGLASAP